MDTVWDGPYAFVPDRWLRQYGPSFTGQIILKDSEWLQVVGKGVALRGCFAVRQQTIPLLYWITRARLWFVDDFLVKAFDTLAMKVLPF